MAKTFLTSIDLVGNELMNASIHNLATAPASPKVGQIYFNTGTNIPMFWNGTAWTMFGHTTSEINTIVRNTTLSGYSVGANSALAAGDTVLGAFGKIQGQLNAKQASDADLTAIAALTGTSGFLKKTAANTWTLDTNTYLLSTATAVAASKLANAQNFSITGGATAAAISFNGTGAVALDVTSLDASKLSTTTTIPSGVLGRSTLYVGTTAVKLNRPSGALALTGITSIAIGSAVLKYDATNNALYVEKSDGTAANFYSTGGVSAYGLGGGGSGSGGGVDMLDGWGNYTEAKADYYVPASLLVPFRSDTLDRLTSLEDGSATSITITGSGNAITSISKSGTVITATKGANFAELGGDGLILSSQLPSYVDDVLEFTTLANFPTTGESGKIYVATGTNLTYRWSGTGYVEISKSLALGTSASTAYRGDHGLAAYNHSQSAHAPSDAQKNSDITKGEIEAKLTGNITSHTHNFGVLTVATGSTNGTISVNTNGTTANVAVKGLGTAAYTAVGDYAPASHNHSASNITSGILGVARGGTGKSSWTAGAVWASATTTLTSGTLPATYGGTGLTDAKDGFTRKLVGTISAALTTVVTHGLGSANVIASVMTTAGEVVECDIINTSTTTTFRFNVAPAANTYKYVIIG